MIRVAGFISILLAVALIGAKVGWEAALYHGSIQQLMDSAELRARYLVGRDVATREGRQE